MDSKKSQLRETGERMVERVKNHPLVTAGVVTAGMTALTHGPDFTSPKEIIEKPPIELREVIHTEPTFEIKVTRTEKIHVPDLEGEDITDFLVTILRADADFLKLPAERRETVVMGVLALTKELNPNLNLTEPAEIVGRELVVPVTFAWKPKCDNVLSLRGKFGGYSVMQTYAEADGFHVTPDSITDIYEQALKAGVDVPNEITEPFYLDRKGSEKSPAILAPDVIDSMRRVGQALSAYDPKGQELPGYKFVVTDILRDEKAQAAAAKTKTGNGLMNSTHPTGRSFDVTKNQWVKPNGELKRMPGPNLRREFVEAAQKEGWVVFEENNAWHIYVPKEITIDLEQEWADYQKP
jgi:hypothetical protein